MSHTLQYNLKKEVLEVLQDNQTLKKSTACFAASLAASFTDAEINAGTLLNSSVTAFTAAALICTNLKMATGIQGYV